MNTRRRTFIALTTGSLVPILASGVAAAHESLTPESSAAALRAWLASRKKDVDTLSIPQLIAEALAFYEEVRFAGLVSGLEGDMLLAQWGTYDWGKGEQFQFGVTRQFIESGKTGDAAITQLHLNAFFVPTEHLRRIEPGNRWCKGVQELVGFRKYIETTEAFKAVRDQRARRVTIEWSPV